MSRRPSHLIPRPILDALLELEDQVRREKDLRALLDESEAEHAEAYMVQVCRVGAARDRVAQLVLDYRAATPATVTRIG